MWAQVIGPPALTFYGIAGGVAFIAGLFRKRRYGNRLLAGLEAASLASAGGFLARLFVAALLTGAHDSPAACLTVGWAFFLWPGAIDTLLQLLGAPAVFTAPVLLWVATAVGAFAGLMDGVWRVHRWAGPGALWFLLDVTWGLAGTTNACLLHLVNIAWGGHTDEPRAGVHRYHRGFFAKRGYALTLGSVMSNLGPHTGDLVRHERIHVLQNRLFGPFYTLTYVGWMAALLVPAGIVGTIRGNPATTVENWCYLNNPWERWAFRHGGWRDPKALWGCRTFAVAAGLFFAGVAGLAGFVVWKVWVAG